MSEGTLRALAAGLCADRGVRVLLGRAWCYHGDSHTIEVPEHQLEELGPVACAGIIAHEVGHAWLSRYHAFAPTGVIPTATMLALNAIEDGRVERWMIGRYPGVARWLEKAHADPGEEPGTPLLTFLLACVRAATQANPPDVQSKYPLVRVALQTTHAARKAYVGDFLPDPTLTPPADADALWDREVSAHDRHKSPEDAREAWVRVLAHRALVHARETILPWVEILLEEEIHAIACALERPAFRVQVSATRSSLIDRLVHRALASAAPGARSQSSEQIARATELLRSLYDSAAQSSAAGGSAIRGAVRGTPDRHPGRRERARYEELLADTAVVRGRLLAALRPAFPPTERPTSGRARSHGLRISLRHALAAEADPRRGTTIFAHPGAPARPRPAFTLLLDLSGSMRGAKIASALRAVVTVAEVLDELRIPFALDGFQDERIPVLAHGEAMGPAHRRAIQELALEVCGDRPGGHNEPSFNDDGPCLLQAAERLAAVQAESRWLLVVSDGRPEGKYSSEDDLRAAIARVGEMRPRVHLVGLGLGRATDHVSELYPRHAAGIEVEALPGKLVEIVRGCVGV